MVKIILAVIGGFIAWSILWIGSDQVLQSVSPDWYGAHQIGFEKAMFNKSEFSPDSTILLMHIVRSVIFSIIAGYLAALIAGENARSPMILGILLLLFGVMVQLMAWNYLPIWYHAIFLLLLVPMSVVGGKLKKFDAASA
ncbi:MAG TPA: hypothetical protein PLN05_10635 [Pyrinomonadaceae bacterium]|nr:hypothetical protein [Chloracidobacterium sp.]HRJ87254.1 hypothetical protein [Pyrinomonadaceae bacterium]HRK50874.1 hypothetical protein [Pyrinomonadaceae bacterium]